MTATMSEAKTVPTTLPEPPNSEVPPMNTAAITVRSWPVTPSMLPKRMLERSRNERTVLIKRRGWTKE